MHVNESSSSDECMISHNMSHVPHIFQSWNLMVEFFLALHANIGAWIHNLERRDMMLLGSLTETYLDLQDRMLENNRIA